MFGEEPISTLVGAVSGAFVAIVGSIFVHKRKNKAQEVSNFQLLFNEISKDIARVRDEQREERKQWAEERTQWTKERESMDGRISQLQAEIQNQTTQLHAKDIQVVELGAKVNLLQSQLDAYREDYTAASKATIKA